MCRHILTSLLDVYFHQRWEMWCLLLMMPAHLWECNWAFKLIVRKKDGVEKGWCVMKSRNCQYDLLMVQGSCKSVLFLCLRRVPAVREVTLLGEAGWREEGEGNWGLRERKVYVWWCGGCGCDVGVMCEGRVWVTCVVCVWRVCECASECVLVQYDTGVTWLCVLCALSSPLPSLSTSPSRRMSDVIWFAICWSHDV